MADFLVFERTVYTRQLDRRMFNFCLIRKPGLILYIFVRLAGAFLDIFGIKAAKKLRWSFLKAAGDLPARFWQKNARRLPRLFLDGERVWLTAYPAEAVSPLAEMTGTALYSGDDWQELYGEAYWQHEPMLIADAYPPKIKSETDTVYIYRGRAVRSEKEFIARKCLVGIYTFLVLLAAGVGLGALCLYIAAGSYRFEMFMSYLSVPLIPLLNILPVVLLVFFMYFLFNRVWAAFGASTLITLLLTLINYFKLSLRNDPLLFSDIGYAAEGGKMALEKYGIQPDLKTVTAVGICVAALLFTIFFARARMRSGRLRLLGLIAAAAIAAGCYKPLYVSAEVYRDTSNNKLVSQWSATGQYMSRGFIYPFLHSIQSAKKTPPEGYSPKLAEEILSRFEYRDMPEEKKVNIVAVMLEAYNDFSKFGVPGLYDEVYGPLHELEEKSYHGELITNIFAGNTVDTEWSFLTGYSKLPEFRKNTESYVRYLREQGYRTEGGHPCYDWFYNRKNVNRYLGFDDYYFFENKYGAINGTIIGDDLFFPDIVDMLETHLESSDQPYFSFSVTYQNHGPYDEDIYWYSGDYVINNGYSDSEMNMMQNYFAGVASTSRNVAETAERISELDEPTVFIVFGDHNPWMGNNNSMYTRLGVDFDFTTTEGFCNYYCTPYIIYANDAAKEALGFDFVGEGPRISPCFLMNLFFELSGMEGSEYMQLADDMMHASPLVHMYELFMADGEVTETLGGKESELYKEFRIAQYYEQNRIIKE